MTNTDFDIVRGSGKVFRLTAREAQTLTGFAAADFSRVRRAKLDRFTIDRLMSILARLGQQVDVTVNVHSPRESAQCTEARP